MPFTRDQILDHLDDDDFWSDLSPTERAEVRAITSTIIVAMNDEVGILNTRIRKSNGLPKRQLEEQRQLHLDDKSRVEARHRQLRAKAVASNSDAKSALSTLSLVVDRHDSLAAAISEHRRATLAEEIEPGPIDLELWALVK